MVEYDPVVYSYARKFFSLPEPHAVFLEDANGWVQRRTGALEGEGAGKGEGEGEEGVFDWVVHDVFTGGQVPGELFTLVRSPFPSLPRSSLFQLTPDSLFLSRAGILVRPQTPPKTLWSPGSELCRRPADGRVECCSEDVERELGSVCWG